MSVRHAGSGAELGGTTSNSEAEDTQAAVRRSASKPSVKDHIQSMGWKQVLFCSSP